MNNKKFHAECGVTQECVRSKYKYFENKILVVTYHTVDVVMWENLHLTSYRLIVSHICEISKLTPIMS
jgi:hypothetical protein